MIMLATPNLTGRESQYLQQCVESTFLSSIGPFVNRFEALCATSFGANRAIATSAGTTGLHVALVAAGVVRDDLVAIPSFTFIATANAVAHCAATPWLFDSDKASWTLDPALLEETFEAELSRPDDGKPVHRPTGRRVGAVMPVYTMGSAADMDRIVPIARRWGLPVIADAAAAHGARFRCRNIGALGADLSVLSFNGNKTLTCGGGGCVIGNDAAQLNLVQHLTTTARRGPAYDHDMVGFNYRMTNIQAAVGCAQLESLDDYVTIKRQIASRYAHAFADLPGCMPFPTLDSEGSAHWLSGLYVNAASDAQMKNIRQKLLEVGIDAREFWKPIHMQRPFEDAPTTPMHITNRVWNRVLTLPCSTHLREDEQAIVIEATRGALRAEKV